MSYIIRGIDGKDWQGANWVFYKMNRYLLPILQTLEGAESLAERLEEALEIEIGYMDMRDLAKDAKMCNLWIKAIDQTITNFRTEGCLHWKKPEEFEPFLAKIVELKKLVKTP